MGQIHAQRVESFLNQTWFDGSVGGDFSMLNPATGETLATGSTQGAPLGEAFAFGRAKGGAALRAMTFGERGQMLSALAKALHEHRERFIAISVANGGNTRKDAKFDIDGATGTLQYYGSVGKKLGEKKILSDGEGIALGRSGRWWGQHIFVPRHGLAVHINAFNFPAWGMWEKAALALLAGVPVLTKPAPQTALLAYEMAKVAVESGLLPDGSFQFLAGPPEDLLDHVAAQDVIAFTGSYATGERIRSHEVVKASGARVGIEADSVNAAVLGSDVEMGGETWHLFLNHLSTEMTQKAGQKCTAIRRIFVPENHYDDVRDELLERMAAVVVGNTAEDGVSMGPLTDANQAELFRRQVAANMEAGGTLLFGESLSLTGTTVEDAFVAPTVIGFSGPTPDIVHSEEVFGPYLNLIQYSGDLDEVVAEVNRGGGGLVACVYSDDAEFNAGFVGGVGAFHGRIYIGDERCASQAMGPGAVLPTLIHGGPGRAGGGEELGGIRGLHHYMQRVAVQGSRKLVSRTFGEEA